MADSKQEKTVENGYEVVRETPPGHVLEGIVSMEPVQDDTPKKVEEARKLATDPENLEKFNKAKADEVAADLEAFNKDRKEKREARKEEAPKESAAPAPKQAVVADTKGKGK